MPTYAKAHLLLRWYGIFGPSPSAPKEEWTAGVRIDIGDPLAWQEAQKVAFLQTIKAASEAFHASADVGAPNACALMEGQAAYIGTNGKYVGGKDQPTTKVLYGPTFGTGGGGVSWDVACAVTLRTAQPRGRGHVGRFYWPCSSEIGTDGLWSTTKATGTAAAAKTLLSAVNQAAQSIWGGAGVSVFSGVGTLEYNQVLRVECGRAPDTQRRRTKKLVEGTTGVDLAAAPAVREARLNKPYLVLSE